jgi:hypothetical protein
MERKEAIKPETKIPWAIESKKQFLNAVPTSWPELTLPILMWMQVKGLT